MMALSKTEALSGASLQKSSSVQHSQHTSCYVSIFCLVCGSSATRCRGSSVGQAAYAMVSLVSQALVVLVQIHAPPTTSCCQGNCKVDMLGNHLWSEHPSQVSFLS